MTKRNGCLGHRTVDAEGWECLYVEHAPGCPNWGRWHIDSGCRAQNDEEAIRPLFHWTESVERLQAAIVSLMKRSAK